MSRITTSKFKLDRRVGTNILGRKKSAFNTRKYIPGVHGRKTVTRRFSDYATELKELRKFRFFYGNLRFKDFLKVFKKVRGKKEKTIDQLVNLLERRLSSFVYRAKWAVTPFGARQLVSHKKILVNGKIVNYPSYKIKVGDEIELATDMQQNPHTQAAKTSTEREIPSYISINNFKGELTTQPEENNTKYPYKVEFNKITSFLSRY